MKRIFLFIIMIGTMLHLNCQDSVSPLEPPAQVRLKTGDGLRNGAYVYFMALSKNVDYLSLFDSEDVFEYDKSDAEWHIDGDSIPFDSGYKVFTKPVGEYSYLLRASGVAMVSTITVKRGKQIWTVHAEHGHLGLDIEYK